MLEATSERGTRGKSLYIPSSLYLSASALCRYDRRLGKMELWSDLVNGSSYGLWFDLSSLC